MADYIPLSNSFSGADMVATCLMSFSDTETKKPYVVGELQTITYSIHIDKRPVRSIGNVNAKAFVYGPRTIAGTLIFAVFDKHFAYRAFEEIGASKDLSFAYMADELPPFDIVVTFANEYGVKAKMVLYNVSLVNEGQVMSINDIYTENTYQFVATDIEYINDSDGFSTLPDNPESELSGTIFEDDNPISGEGLSGEVTDDPEEEKSSKISLNYEVLEFDAENNKGKVKLMLSEKRESGKILVYPEETDTLEFNATDIPDKELTIALIPGNYKAMYSDESTGEATDKISFKIESTPKEKILAAPVVLHVSNDRIVLFINEENHNTVFFKSESQDAFSNEEFSNKEITIKGLQPNTKYEFYTANANEKSPSVIITTPTEIGNDLKKVFSYIEANKTSFNLGSYDDCVAILDEIILSLSKESYKSLSAMDLLYNLKAETAALKEEENKKENPDTDKINAYDQKIKACNDILIIAPKIINDLIYAYNEGTAIVKQPELKAKNSDDTILLDRATEYIKVYKYFGKPLAIATIYKKSEFASIDDQYEYKLLGAPGERYGIYAYDQNGHRSPKLELYIMDDETKEKVTSYMINFDEKFKEDLSRAESKYKSEIEKLKFPKHLEQRMLFQLMKNNTETNFPSPILIKSNERLEAQIYYKQWLGQNPQVTNFLIISKLDEMFYDADLYKINIPNYQEKITIPMEYYKINSGNSYAIWIEDSEGNQISPCETFTEYTSNQEKQDMQEQEDEMYMFFRNRFLTDFKKQIKSYSNNASDIDALIERIEDEQDDIVLSHEQFLLQKLIHGIVDHDWRIAYELKSKLMLSVFKAWHNQYNTINSDLLTEKITYSKTENILTLKPQENIEYFTIIVKRNIKSNQYRVDFETYTEADLIINRDENDYFDFVIAYAINSKNPKQKSGFVLIDNTSNSHIAKDVEIEVI